MINLINPRNIENIITATYYIRKQVDHIMKMSRQETKPINYSVKNGKQTNLQILYPKLKGFI